MLPATHAWHTATLRKYSSIDDGAEGVIEEGEGVGWHRQGGEEGEEGDTGKAYV